MTDYTNFVPLIEYYEAEEEGEVIDNDVIWSFCDKDDEDEPTVGAVHLRIELEEWDIDGNERHTLCGVVETYRGDGRWENDGLEDFFEHTPEQIANWVDEEHRAEVLAAVHKLFAEMKGISKMAA